MKYVYNVTAKFGQQYLVAKILKIHQINKLKNALTSRHLYRIKILVKISDCFNVCQIKLINKKGITELPRKTNTNT